MPILKRNPKSKESKKTVTPNYVEKTKSKSKGVKPTPASTPTSAPSPTSGPKPSIGSRTSKPRPNPTPGNGGTKPRPGGTTPKPKPNPGTNIPRPRTKTPVAGQSGKLNVEKLRQISHNKSMHSKGTTGGEKPSLSKQTPKQIARDFFGKKSTSAVGKKAGSTNRVLRKGGSTKRK